MPEKIMVEIPLDEYRELVKSKAVADTLLAFIHCKNKGYCGMKHDEVEMLDMLYNKQKEES